MSIHRAAAAAVLLTLAACRSSTEPDGPPQPAPGERFTATLTAASVVPATSATSSGSITVEVRDDSLLTFALTVNNMTGITQAHLHNAAAGANGPVLAWLLPVNGTAAQAPSVTLSGVVAIGDIAPTWIRGTPRLSMDSVKTLLRNGRLYVDVHTSAFTNGELRGQLAPVR
jgi:predicted component of type VI protein secretion system